jgi:hypothetical protein
LVKRKVKLSPWSRAVERNAPSRLVTVWGSPSRFFQVTTPPTGIFISIGEYMKFLIVTVTVVAATCIGCG